MKKLKLRKQHYLMPPPHFGIRCPKCKEETKVAWSEYEDHLWCYSCEEDLYHSSHEIYPIQIATMLGMNFDIVVIGKGIDRYNVNTGKYEFVANK